ncbi:hypothetical protein BH23GEM6_BH23GEM6_20630 [soil metagenome]
MKRLFACLALAAVTACGDSPTSPPQATSVQIQAGGNPIVEQIIEVGKSVQLTAVVQMTRGSVSTPVQWQSTAPSVASVDPGGVVTGVSAGTALIVARADRVADTVQVTVTQPSPAETTCGPDQPRLNLAPGQVHQTRARDASLLCLPGTQAGAEYVVIPYFASTGPGTLAIEVLGGGIQAPVLPVHPSVAPSAAATFNMMTAAQQSGREDHQFHMRMRQMERSLLATRPSRDIRPSLSLSTTTATPAVGDVLRLNASTESCTNANWRGGRVEAVSARSIVVGDTLNPSGGFTRSDYEAFAAEFDSRVWPVVTQNFGAPSDIDANQRVIIFFTVAVNELTTPGSGSFVGGFYHPRDLFPRTGTNSCATSNEAEVLYQLVPDTARARANNETFLNRDQVQRRTVAVIAHELQHLVNTSRRLFEFDAPLESVWLNEGLSHIAEELIFYDEAGLGPGQNITIETLRSSQRTLTAVNRHQISNIGRFITFIESPSAFSFADGNDLVTRGGAWAFLRYAADRRAAPGDQRQIWFNLVNTREVGINNVARVFNITPFDWFQDWTVSVLLDDSGIATEDRFSQPSWHYRSVVGALMQGMWPLQTRTLTDNQPLELTLRPGATGYLRLGVGAGTTGGVRVTSNRQIPPETLRLSIVRTR